MACCRLSKARAAFALTNLVAVPISPVLMVKLRHQATAALNPCYQELNAALPNTTAGNCDETPMKEGANKALWTIATPLSTVFAIALTCTASVVEGLLGANDGGIVSSDRYARHNAYNKQRRI
jgi:hypothetical protein